MRTGKYPFALATRKFLSFINFSGSCRWGPIKAGRKVNGGCIREHDIEGLKVRL